MARYRNRRVRVLSFAKRVRCDVCGTMLYLSPSRYRKLRKRAEIRCNECNRQISNIIAKRRGSPTEFLGPCGRLVIMAGRGRGEPCYLCSEENYEDYRVCLFTAAEYYWSGWDVIENEALEMEIESGSRELDV
jgi:ribosomal protein S27E